MKRKNEHIKHHAKYNPKVIRLLQEYEEYPYAQLREEHHPWLIANSQSKT